MGRSACPCEHTAWLAGHAANGKLTDGRQYSAEATIAHYRRTHAPLPKPSGYPFFGRQLSLVSCDPAYSWSPGDDASLWPMQGHTKGRRHCVVALPLLSHILLAFATALLLLLDFHPLFQHVRHQSGIYGLRDGVSRRITSLNAGNHAEAIFPMVHLQR